MKKFILVGFFILTVFSAIAGITGFPYEIIKSGDLIFRMEGKSEFSKAISESTAFEDSVKFVHVGIIEIDDEIPYVIEASPEKGVRRITLDSFLESSIQEDGDPRVVIKRVSIDFPVEQVIANALGYIGEGYDWWYLPDNEKMYCSELVYESYVTESGEKIFSTKPMNFRDSEGEMPEFWIRLFRELDMDVPEGMEGTNPNDMSKDPVLVTIYHRKI